MRVLALATLTLLAACTGKPSFKDPALSERQLNLEEFFDGTLVAKGQFQDIFGTVRRRFDVTITGDWNGKRLRLVEDFVYEDGSTEQRVWTLVKTGTDTPSQTWRGARARGRRPLQLALHHRPSGPGGGWQRRHRPRQLR